MSHSISEIPDEHICEVDTRYKHTKLFHFLVFDEKRMLGKQLVPNASTNQKIYLLPSCVSFSQQRLGITEAISSSISVVLIRVVASIHTHSLMFLIHKICCRPGPRFPSISPFSRWVVGCYLWFLVTWHIHDDFVQFIIKKIPPLPLFVLYETSITVTSSLSL